MTTAFDSGEAVFGALSPPEPGDVDIQALVEDAGWEVSAVDWIFEKVTGESIVEKVIMPITGDFNKIIQDANGWRNVGECMTAFADTMKANADTVREGWKGPAAMAHEAYIDVGWKAGLTIESKIAETIAKGFDKLADGSQKLCEQALTLLKKLVRKLVEAVAESWIPVYGWVRAADMVWSAYQIYKMILEIIEMVKSIIESVKEILSSLQSIGSQLAKIKDIRNVEDAAEIAGNVKDEVSDISDEAGNVQENAGDIAQTTSDIGDTGSGAAEQDAETAQAGADARQRQEESERQPSGTR